MAETAKTASKMASLFWGRVAPLSRRIRLVALAFTMATIVSLSFCQLGFWPIGEVAGRAVYIMLILVPPIVGALLFGPLTGALLGLFAGAMAFAHADLMPLDFYENNIMTPLNTFGMLTFVGLFAGLLFSFALRHDPRGKKRVGIIIGICIDSMPIKCIDQMPIPSVIPPAMRQNRAAFRLERGIFPALSSATKEAINATR